MADSKVSALTAASALDGTELFYVDQGSADRKGTAAQIKTFTSASPTLVTPDLGTPSAGVLTNATGLPVSTGISGLGTGVATFLATPSSANLAAALTDETGTGANVFANTPTLVTPILGTPTSGTLTNCTGLPISTGVSGLGSNVATALATPSSANLAAAITDETGSGALVFANTPTLVTPVIGAATGTSVVVTGVFQGRTTLDNTNPVYSFSGDTNSGFSWRSADVLSMICGGSEPMRWASNTVYVLSSNLTIGGATKGIIFNSADNTGGTDDTGVARNAAAKVEINTGTKGTLGDIIVRQPYVDYTNTATVGAVTINKACGQAIIASGATSVTVTNSLVTANSQVFCTIAQNDATATLKNCVASSGSFVITITAAATADTKVNFLVVNQ